MPIVEPLFAYLILFIISNWEWIQLAQYLIEFKEFKTSVLSSIIIWGGWGEAQMTSKGSYLNYFLF
jgi:hypothetical protein